MEQIVLNLNLKYLINLLNIHQRGELFTALLEQAFLGSDEVVKGMFDYLMSLQQSEQKKHQHMKEISLKGVAARLKNLSENRPAVDRRLTVKERKEAKESKININKNNLFSLDKNFVNQKVKVIESEFEPPSLDLVKNYVQENQLKVDAETFLNFYQSHGWKVGSTAISCWQATVKLWHLRAVAEEKKHSALPAPPQLRENDETYWHQLQNRVSSQISDKQTQFVQPVMLTESARRNLADDHFCKEDLDFDCQPFERFMNRVKKYDIQSENENE